MNSPRSIAREARWRRAKKLPDWVDGPYHIIQMDHPDPEGNDCIVRWNSPVLITEDGKYSEWVCDFGFRIVWTE